MRLFNKREFKKSVSNILLIAFLITFLTPILPSLSNGGDNRVVAEEVYSTSYLATKAAQNNMQLFLKGDKKVGTNYGDIGAYDIYILSKEGNIDVASYVYDNKSLKEEIVDISQETIDNYDEKKKDYFGNEVYKYSSKEIAHEYLAMKSLGETHKKNQLLDILKNRQNENGFDNNLYGDAAAFEALGRAGVIDNIDVQKAVDYILKNKSKEGGIPLAYSDFKTTAQSIRALIYLKNYVQNKDEVQAGIDKGLKWLKDKQLKDGSFNNQNFDDPIIDTVEVILTLKVLNEDLNKWKVNNNGPGPVDYMKDTVPKNKKFMEGKEVSENTWALDAYIKMGAKVGKLEKTVINSHGDKNLPEDASAYISIKGKYGYILRKSKVKIVEYDAVLGFTTRVLKNKNIDYRLNERKDYIASIDGLAEEGKKSGWMFNINEKTSVSGANDTDVEENDYIEWFYTLDYTKDSRNTNRKISVNEENVDDVISNKEYKDAYNKITAKNVSDKEIIKVVDEISNKLENKINNMKNEKEAKELIDNLKDIYTIINKASQKIDSQEVLNDIAKNSNKLINNTLKVYEKVIDKDKKEEINKRFEKNIGLTLNIISDIKDEKSTENIIEDIFKVSSKINNNTVVYFDGDKNNVKAKLPSVFIKKAVQKNISTINIKSDIASVKVKTNSLDKDKNITLKAKKIDTSDLSKSQKNVVPDNSIVIAFEMNDGKESITKFKHPIEVTIPYEKNTKNKDKVNVFYLKNDGTLENMGGVYNPKTKTVKFITNHFGKYFAKRYTKEFSDLDTVKWAKDAIQIMASKGIINGKGNNKFSPDNNITRAEFAALITRILKYQESDNELKFKDVNKDKWYYDSINAAYQNKIINGKSETIFDPNGNITRQEMTKIIASVLEERGYKKGNSKNLNAFKDKDDIASWAKESVGLSAKEGIITGMNNKTFAPNEKATRAQATVMLYRLYNLIMK